MNNDNRILKLLLELKELIDNQSQEIKSLKEEIKKLKGVK